MSREISERASYSLYSLLPINSGRVKVSVTYDISQTNNPKDKAKLYSGREVVVRNVGTLSVMVTDSGPGLTQEQMSHLFRQNVQFDANRLQHGNGSGLGLFIAKGIVEQHGGSLTVSSPGLGQGSTFTFTLPLFDLPENTEVNVGILEDIERSIHHEDKGMSPSTDKQESPNSQVLRILVVDDSSTNRRFLIRWLRNRGHICDEACDGVEAVDMVATSEHYYDAILMDYEMPRLNGPKATREIRKQGCDSFVVGVSGNVLPEDVAVFREHGANAVLPKPVRFPDLESLLSEYAFPDRGNTLEAS